MSGWSQIALTTASAPCTTLSTPAGTPASIASSQRRIVTIGSCSDGFSTKVLPQAIAIGNIHSGIIAGKLNGVMPAHTPQGLQQCVRVDAVGHVVGQLAQLQVADAGCVLDNLEAAEHVAFGIGERLALLGGQDGRQLLHVLADQLLVLQEDAGARADRCLAPRPERAARGGDGGIDLVRSRERHAREQLLRRRVDDVAPLLRAGLHELAVDQQRNARNVGGHR